MDRKEVANTFAHRALAWVLILALGVGAIAGGIVITASGYQNSLIVIDSGYGGLTNVVFFLIGISVALAIYLLQGFSVGVWSLSVVAVLIVLAYSIVLLTLGMVGLAAIVCVGIGVEMSKRLRTKNTKNDA